VSQEVLVVAGVAGEADLAVGEEGLAVGEEGLAVAEEGSGAAGAGVDTQCCCCCCCCCCRRSHDFRSDGRAWMVMKKAFVAGVYNTDAAVGGHVKQSYHRGYRTLYALLM
jgi:hypothetical protein